MSAVAERFWAKVDKSAGPDGCWLWTAARTKKGYGSFLYLHENRFAHRVAFILEVGPIPDGLSVCHRCDVRHCVNPSHFFLGTQADNVADMMKKGRFVEVRSSWTHCKRGHEFNQQNTYNYHYRGRDRRYCLVCTRDRQLRQRAS